MLQDGPKKVGRFIKKKDKVLEHIVLQEYSLEEISESPIVSFDNSKSTIVHSKFHDQTALNNAVKAPPYFDNSLIDPSNNRSIIMPRDFTADWRASRSKAGSKRKENDEDDDLLLGTSVSSSSSSTPTDTIRVFEEPAVAAAPAPFKFERFEQGSAQTESLEQLRPSAPIFDPNEVVKAAAAMAIHNGPAVDPHESSMSGSNSSSFITMNTRETGKPSNQVASPEVAAAEEYRNRVAVEEANEKILTTLKEEARSAGYQGGFKLGEEKAELQSRSSSQALFGHVAELIGEFEGLKQLVLSGAQQNFYELAQAMGEALLGKEFSIRPDALAAVIRKAVDETVESDAFKIRVHPDTFEKLSKLEMPDLKKRLVKDSSVGVDHFKIESHLTVVDQNAKKLIANLLEQADVDLFAGTEIKAG